MSFIFALLILVTVLAFTLSLYVRADRRFRAKYPNGLGPDDHGPDCHCWGGY